MNAANLDTDMLITIVSVKTKAEAEALCEHFRDRNTHPGVAVLACATLIGMMLADNGPTRLIPPKMRTVLREMAEALIAKDGPADCQADCAA